MDDFKIISFNAEGLSPAKIQILSDLKADILCLQETHKIMSHPVVNTPVANPNRLWSTCSGIAVWDLPALTKTFWTAMSQPAHGLGTIEIRYDDDDDD